jgi:hypothetical protein
LEQKKPITILGRNFGEKSYSERGNSGYLAGLEGFGGWKQQDCLINKISVEAAEQNLVTMTNLEKCNLTQGGFKTDRGR